MLADSLAQNLAGPGLSLERASVNQARTASPSSPPRFIVLAGDAARDRGAAVLAQRAQAGDDSTPVVVICAAQPGGALPRPPSARHIAYLTPEGGVKECARRLKALVDAFTSEGLATRSLEQLLSRAAEARAPDPAAPATPLAPEQRVLGSMQPPTRPLGNPSKRAPLATSAAMPAPPATGTAAGREPAGAKPGPSANQLKTAFGAPVQSGDEGIAKREPVAGSVRPGPSAAKPWPAAAQAFASAATPASAGAGEAARAAPVAGAAQLLPTAAKPPAAQSQASAEAVKPSSTAAGAWPASKQAKAAFGTLSPTDAAAQPAATSLPPTAAKPGEASPKAAGAFGRLAQPTTHETRPIRPKSLRAQPAGTPAEADAGSANAAPAGGAKANVTAPEAARKQATSPAKTGLAHDERPTHAPAPPSDRPLRAPAPLTAKAAPPKPQPQARPDLDDERPTGPAAPPAATAAVGKKPSGTEAELAEDDRPTGPAAPPAAKPAAPARSISTKDRSTGTGAGEEELTTLYGSELRIELALPSPQPGADEEETQVAPPIPQPPSPPRQAPAKGIAAAHGIVISAPRVTRQDASEGATAASDAAQRDASLSPNAGAAPRDVTHSRRPRPPASPLESSSLAAYRSPSLTPKTGASPRDAAPSQRPRPLASPLEPANVAPQRTAAPATNTAAAPGGVAPSQRPRRIGSPLEPVSIAPQRSALPNSTAPGAAAPSQRPRRIGSPLEPVSLAPQQGARPATPEGASAAPGAPTAARRSRRPASPLEPVVSYAPPQPRRAAASNSNAAFGDPGSQPRSRAGDPLRAPQAWPQAIDLPPDPTATEPKRRSAAGRNALIACTLAALGGSAYLLRDLYTDSGKPLDSRGAAGALEQVRIAPPPTTSPTANPPEAERNVAAPVSPSDPALAKPSAQPDRPSAGRSTGHSREPEPDTDQGRAQALVKEGAELARRGRIGLAEGLYLKALQVVPNYPNAMAELVRVHLARRDGAEAVRWAERLIAAQPENAVHQLLLGDAHALRGDQDSARAAWNKAAKAGNALARKRLEEE